MEACSRVVIVDAREDGEGEKNFMEKKKENRGIRSPPASASPALPFGRLLSISFVLSRVCPSFRSADQHPDAYPNGLTIPIEPHLIRVPMATGRKGIPRHGDSSPSATALIL